MRRFWREVSVEPADTGWQVALDGRMVKTAQGRAQVVPTRALGEALADEWRVQPDEVSPAGFGLRDMADYAIDIVSAEPGDAIRRILAYAQGETLCYRAEPDEPLAARQRAIWEPLLNAAEAAHRVRFERVVGILHRPQPAATLNTLQARLEALDPFTLAALQTLSSLAASLVIGLAALEPGADAETLFTASNLEEDWQAEQWGWDYQAEETRARKLATFVQAARFAVLARP
ncbi:ATP12 family chaperone protein [Novosphingobium sp. Gsoil 351]|uniref:ATP12 family chaperone protein n=1 Tax=Novosphingobium sp. Gsoil 351 TaxID=2675225 RepID=UPI0012B44626|nr:ATP12 family protein [Novosphingobium sp. Gsoil 351]QGN55286.1 molecular chaperone [Novosphingobium sp. Gsoil 351]